MLSSVHHESVYISAPLRNRASLPRDQLNGQLSLTARLPLTPDAAPVTKIHAIGPINIHSFYIQVHLCSIQYIYVCQPIYVRISLPSIYIYIRLSQYSYVPSDIRYCYILASGSTKKTHSSIYSIYISTPS